MLVAATVCILLATQASPRGFPESMRPLDKINLTLEGNEWVKIVSILIIMLQFYRRRVLRTDF